MMFNQYPYLNVNDLNLDYILSQIKVMMNEVTNFVSINAIKYADPIQWDITRQYEKNTVVIDPVTGTAYISVAPVPAGVALTRPEYWTVVFDLGSFVTRAAQNFTSRYEQETTLTATFPTNTGEWLVWGDVLYKALTNITAGDTYVVDGNIEHFTIEDLYNTYLNTIASILALVGDLADLTTSDTTSIVNAINSVLTDLNGTINDVNLHLTSEIDNVKTVVDFPSFPHYVDVANIKTVSSIMGQGGVVTDNYIFAAFRNVGETQATIYKIDRASNVYTTHTYNNLGHANSLTFGENKLFVCPITVNGNYDYNIYVLNPSTMAIDSVITLPYNPHCIAYDNGYLYIFENTIGIDGGKIMHKYEIATATDEIIFTLPAEIAGLQDIDTDGRVLYVLDLRRTSVLVYDFEGNYINTIKIPYRAELTAAQNGEIESITVLNDDMYLSTRNPVGSYEYCNYFAMSIYGNNRDDSYASGEFLTYQTVYVDSNAGLLGDGTQTKPFNNVYSAVRLCESFPNNAPQISCAGTFTGEILATDKTIQIVNTDNANPATFIDLELYGGEWDIRSIILTDDANGNCLTARHSNIILTGTTITETQNASGKLQLSGGYCIMNNCTLTFTANGFMQMGACILSFNHNTRSNLQLFTNNTNGCTLLGEFNSDDIPANRSTQRNYTVSQGIKLLSSVANGVITAGRIPIANVQWSSYRTIKCACYAWSGIKQILTLTNDNNNKFTGTIQIYRSNMLYTVAITLDISDVNNPSYSAIGYYPHYDSGTQAVEIATTDLSSAINIYDFVGYESEI